MDLPEGIIDKILMGLLGDPEGMFNARLTCRKLCDGVERSIFWAKMVDARRLKNVLGLNESPLEIHWLDQLCLDAMELEELPKEVCSLNRLTTLSACKNYFKRIPREIGLLTELEWLDLSLNSLEELPEEICLLNLWGIHLSRNQLKALPEGFGRLTTLLVVNIECNKIKRLPDGLENLVNLYEISVDGDLLSQLPSNLRRVAKSPSWCFLDFFGGEAPGCLLFREEAFF